MKTPKIKAIGRCLFHPFITIAGFQALGLGLAAILLTSWWGSWSGAHFDGVLDTHVGAKLPLWIFLSEGVIDWLSLALVLLVTGRLLSKTAFRSLDLLGTQALARWPMLFVSLMCLAPGFHRYTQALVKSLTTLSAHPTTPALPGFGMDAVVFISVTLGMLTCVVWMVALMWKSFAHCCNMRGGLAITGFVVGLLVAEVISKLAILQMFRSL
jgi:hypothetical protein